MKMKKLFTAFMAVICMFTCISTTAFAVDTDNETPTLTSHTVSFTVPAGEIDANVANPMIWGQFCPGIISDYVYNTDPFYIPDRNFAYEVWATRTDGTPVEENYGVSLMIGTGTKAIISGKANGTVYKNDWISVVPNNYYFKINNSTSADLNVNITYYSWQ